MWFPSWSLLFGLPTLFGLSEASTSSGNKQHLPYTSMSYNSKTWEASVDCNAAIGACRNFDQVKPFQSVLVRPLWIFPNLYNRCQHTQHFQIVFHSDTHKAWDCTSTGDLIICPTSCRFQPALCSDNTIPIIYTYLYSCFRSHDSSILQPFVQSRPWQVHKVCTIHLICDISIYIYIMHIKYVLYNITCGLLGPCAGMPRASEAVSRCTKARAWVSCGANESNVKAQKSPWHEKCHRCVVATNRNKEVKQKTNNDIIKIYLYI